MFCQNPVSGCIYNLFICFILKKIVKIIIICEYNQAGEPIGIEIEIEKFSQFQLIQFVSDEDEVLEENTKYEATTKVVYKTPGAKLEISVKGTVENELGVTSISVADDNREIIQFVIDNQKVREIFNKDQEKKDITIFIDLEEDDGSMHSGTIIILPGDLIQIIEERQGTLEVKTNDVSWFITAEQLLEQHYNLFGNKVLPKDFEFAISITKPNENRIKEINKQATKQDTILVGVPYEMNISAANGGQKTASTGQKIILL